MAGSVLATLKATEASLADPELPFRFLSWQHCACGHLYRGAHGEFKEAGFSRELVTPEAEAAARVIVETVDRYYGGGWSNPLVRLSDLVHSHSESECRLVGRSLGDESIRATSLRLVRATIDKLEARAPEAVEPELVAAI